MVCHNKLCGYQSLEDQDAIVCRLCYISQKNRREIDEDPDELKAPDLKRVSGVTYNREENKFIMDDDFFGIIEIEER